MIEFPWGKKWRLTLLNLKAFADLGGLSEAGGFVQWAAAVVEEIRGRSEMARPLLFSPIVGGTHQVL